MGHHGVVETGLLEHAWPTPVDSHWIRQDGHDRPTIECEHVDLIVVGERPTSLDDPSTTPPRVHGSVGEALERRRRSHHLDVPVSSRENG